MLIFIKLNSPFFAKNIIILFNLSNFVGNSDFVFFGRLAQLVEHLVYTEGVKGSSPLLPTKNSRGCSSVWLERLPVTQEAAGSSPVTPAIIVVFLKYFTKKCDLRSLSVVIIVGI